MSTFVAVCQRHRFETDLLPKAKRRGWPLSIDWAGLRSRIEALRERLQDIIADTEEVELSDTERDAPDEDGGSSEDDEGDGGNEDVQSQLGPRARSTFWREIVKQMKQKGARGVTGVRAQFATFEKAQPG